MRNGSFQVVATFSTLPDADNTSGNVYHVSKSSYDNSNNKIVLIL